MNDVQLAIYESICEVAGMNTDFEIGFDVLFKFMGANPYSKTTRQFIDYHIREIGAPRLEDGRPDFTYLICRHFAVEDWVSQEDVEEFMKYYINS